MEAREEIHSYYLLRWFRPAQDEPDHYAKEISYITSRKRNWSDTTTLENAYRFDSKGDARRTVRSNSFDDLRRRGFYWEIVEVKERTVRTYTAAVVVSDAPPLVVIARAAS